MKNCLVAASAVSLLSLISSSCWAQAEADSKGIKIQRKGEVCVVTLDGNAFTKLHLDGYQRPILYPVLGPNQTPMTRNYPMKPDVEGEAEDHPHHKSIWCGHGLINEISFWHEQGSIAVAQDKPMHIRVQPDGKSGSITFSCNYLGPDEKLVCTDKSTISFHDLGDARAIDWDITLRASEGDLTFGDTKEGMMAIRTHPSLRIDKGATAVNSNGAEGGGIWGKKAAWVDYSAEVEGNHVGVAIFDHPENLRHPTTWHARAYGLVAANPFGLHHFQDQPLGTGEHHLAQGDELRFRYRFVFHSGDTEAGKIAERFAEFAKTSQ